MIKFIFVDSKRGFLDSGVAEYITRIKSFTPVSVKFVKSSRFKERELVLRDEAIRIRRLLREDDCVIVLDEKGRCMGSRDFASFLNRELSTCHNVVFVVGGAWGIEVSLKREFLPLSLSLMTFSHFTARLVLVEQIYRAFCILNGLSYVK